MKIIHEAHALYKTLGWQKKKEGEYRFLTYAVQLPVDDGVLLFHTITRELVFLNKEEAAKAEDCEELIKRRFLVPIGSDDRKLYEQMISWARLIVTKSRTINYYTIFTTTDCNARCFYCFEKDATRITMTESTAHDVAKYIINKHNGKKVHLNWFGGEPLFNNRVIDIICQDLQAAGIEYRSKMISNGYLFDDDIVNRAKKLWKLSHVQITLDGTEEVYNRSKRYIYKDGSAFQRVMKNIGLLLGNGISVHIRMNIGKHNAQDIKELVKELASLYARNSILTINARMVLQYKEDYLVENRKVREEIGKHIKEIETLIKALGMRLPIVKFENASLYCCMADNPHSITITPDGNIGKCEHFTNKEFVSSIYSGEFHEDVLKGFTKYYPIEKLCIDTKCAAFPFCFKPIKCPTVSKCISYKQARKLESIRNRMRELYEQFRASDCLPNENVAQECSAEVLT